MAKRYLGGGISFEQKNVYQEFSEEDTPAGGGSLVALSDVDISNPANGQTLVYNAASGKWENGAGGIASVLIVRIVANNTLDKTWSEIHSAGFSVLDTGEEQFLQMGCVEDNGEYLVIYWTFGMSEPDVYITSSATGYPSLNAQS